MFKRLSGTFPRDNDFPERVHRLTVLNAVLTGTLYDNLTHAFAEEKTEGNEYIPLIKRRPSVRYGLCRTVVDDSVSLLFSEGHFPEIDCNDEKLREDLSRFIKELSLNQVMIDAATRGSIGSVAILFRVLDSRVFLGVSDTIYMTPAWKASAPDTLESVTEKYKVKGKVLKDLGWLDTAEEGRDYWFRRDWTETEEISYVPWLVEPDKPNPAAKDEKRSVTHNLGFVPVVWVKNLPGGDEVDGACTFPSEAIDSNIEIDYQLSQAGRGLKYSSDPTLLIKEPAMGEGEKVKGGGNAIIVDKDGDAKVLEINGTAVSAVIEYVRLVRELALETMHGNRSSADKLSTAQSGRAMELMHSALIALADRLRISYGEGALLQILGMIVKAQAKFPLIFKDGSKVGDLSQNEPVALRWSEWFPPTPQDALNKANTIKTLRDSGNLSRETAVKSIAADYDIEDVQAEVKAIEVEEAAREAAAKKNVNINA